MTFLFFPGWLHFGECCGNVPRSKLRCEFAACFYLLKENVFISFNGSGTVSPPLEQFQVYQGHIATSKGHNDQFVLKMFPERCFINFMIIWEAVGCAATQYISKFNQHLSKIV